MNAASRELFRQCLLIQLSRIRGFAAPASVLRVGAQVEGFEATLDDVGAEMQYLEDKGLVAVDAKPISPENKRWRLTADGRDYLAQEGLA